MNNIDKDNRKSISKLIINQVELKLNVHFDIMSYDLTKKLFYNCMNIVGI